MPEKQVFRTGKGIFQKVKISQSLRKQPKQSRNKSKA
jgi:hypothetical protein